ncbi:tape measure protein [Stutzerimonas nitrititolerans]|uniref:tape measure protein n=1 Tax=Stutzerimonas nitrititolerans TaxID=2482751 RepID=UPI00289E8306|nr:tape measure protein [Stutzerimonas nitrititolerans]
MAESARLIISVDSRQVQSADRALGALGRTSSAVASAISAVTAGFGVRELYQASEAYQTITNRLKLVTQGNEGLATAQAAVFDIAQKSGQSLTATAELYQRIAQNQDALKLSGEGVAGIVDTISKAMVISGASASSAQAALIQLGQAFASGTLRGEELNSVMEQAPALSQAIAKGMGKTVGELRALGAEGKLTADAVVQALQSQAGAVDDLFGKMQDTMGTGLTRIGNSFTNLVGKMNEVSGVSASIAGSFTTVSAAVDSLTEDADSLAATVATVGAVMSGVAAGGAVLLADKLMVSVVASRAARAANIAQAESALQNAIANQRAAQTAVVRATAEAQAARGTAVQTHMSIQLAQARMVEARANTQVAASQVALTTASRGLLGALAGPAGLALLVGAAASALYVFRDSAADARPPVDALAGSVDALSDASIRLARISAKEKLAQLAEEAKTLERNVTSARDLMDRGFVDADSRYLDRLEKEEAQLQKNKEEVTELQKRIEDLDKEQGRRSDGGPQRRGPAADSNAKDAKKLASAYDSVSDALSRQLALYGQTGEAARVSYELASGSLKGIVGKEADYILGLARELDIKEQLSEQEQIRIDILRESGQLRAANDAQFELEYAAKIAEYERQGNVEALQRLETLRRIREIQMNADMAPGTVEGVSQAPDSGGVDAAVGGAGSEFYKLQEEAVALEQWRTTELEKQRGFLEAKAITEEEYATRIANIHAQHQQEVSEIEQARYQVSLAGAADLFGNLADITAQFAGDQSGLYKTMFIAQKAFAIAQSMIAIQQGIALAAANPWPLNLGAMASVAAATAGLVSNIAAVGMSFDGGGYTGNGPRSGGLDGKGGFLAMMHPQETVIDHTKSSGKSGSGGGAGVVVNLIEDASKAGQVEQSSNDNGEQVLRVWVARIRAGGTAESQAIEQAFGLQRAGR